MFTREQVLDAALTLTRQRGIGALTARALGEQLGIRRSLLTLPECTDILHDVIR